MIFLIEYLRADGRLIKIERFDDSDRHRAQKARLKTELELLGRQVDHEVVLLEAETEDALRKTHRRYFESAQDLARANGS